MTLATLVVLAHQSDWLSMVLVLIPLALFSMVLVVAKRRAERDGPVTLGAPDSAPSDEPERPSST